MVPRWRLLIVGCAIAGWSTLTVAQTVYKWTDESGIVHFSDLPPANMKNVEERYLPSQHTVEGAPADSGTGTSGGETSEQKTTPGEGPSRVILVSSQTPRTGPSALHVIGKVKNVGGADAKNVSVTISAVDSTQGTPCLREDASVTPSTLPPGETGEFDVSLDSPCLYGEPNLDVVPAWE